MQRVPQDHTRGPAKLAQQSSSGPAKLALDHPDYRYSESRNPYWQKLRSESRQVFPDNDSELHRGRWREQFPGGKSSSKLHVEIGCNAGHVVLEWAAREPKGCFIGIDWKFKMIH